MNLAGNTETVFVVRIYSVHRTYIRDSKPRQHGALQILYCIIKFLMYNRTSFINEADYAEVSGTRWIMRDLPNYAQGHQLCAKLCARIIA